MMHRAFVPFLGIADFDAGKAADRTAQQSHAFQRISIRQRLVVDLDDDHARPQSRFCGGTVRRHFLNDQADAIVCFGQKSGKHDANASNWGRRDWSDRQLTLARRGLCVRCFPIRHPAGRVRLLFLVKPKRLGAVQNHGNDGDAERGAMRMAAKLSF
jgi:hypothetical protein